ncbi:3D domain-containing protein [Ureibacillus sinduriensis]|uniref:Peptidoglycan-binding protein n=1 Tax=Ureibacillus sinduriensis BLB-1 = JCM 15800 TaxID=1384057 RepID=A0A0A3IP70_9BACL|nr:3D domain-containing protein [Ureibacillus sinduriensis]KGR76637.1 peptidoglycan-binding protein [Ureibacillus sinduriensis BLB-1 = JCM 15800]
MLKKLISIVPAAALTLTVGANVQAASYTVQKGDTLWDLARANNTSVETIQTVNNLKTDLIHPGDLLTIAKEKRYTIKQGDTLWDIANTNDVTISQIKEWNNLHSDLIHPDSNLVIFEGAKKGKIAVSEKTAEPAAQENRENAPQSTVSSSNSDASKISTPKVNAASPSHEVSKESTSEATAPVEKHDAPKASVTEETHPSTESSETKELIVEATAYTASCEGCSGITSTGINLKENPNAKVISVDPSVIPLGSRVYVEGYGEAIAGDTGGGIKGNRIDVFIPSKQDAINYGVKQLKVTILD